MKFEESIPESGDDDFVSEALAAAQPFRRYKTKMIPDNTEEEVQRQKAEIKVAPYRVHTAGKKSKKDRSIYLESKVNPNETHKLTAETHKANCTCSTMLCNTVQKRDEMKCDKSKSPEALKYKTDLVDKFVNADALVENV